MICKNCGNQAEANTTFCLHCGAPLNESDMKDFFYGDQVAPEGNQAEINQQANAGMSQEMNQGYNQGMNQGYNQGMNQGYNQGMNQGYNQGMNQGYNQGMNQGYNQGMNQGYNQGMNQGMNQGYNQGMNQGYNQGMNQGYNQGMNQGYNQGMNQGYNQGMNQGFNQGMNQGYNQGMNSGVSYYGGSNMAKKESYGKKKRNYVKGPESSEATKVLSFKLLAFLGMILGYTIFTVIYSMRNVNAYSDLENGEKPVEVWCTMEAMVIVTLMVIACITMKKLSVKLSLVNLGMSVGLIVCKACVDYYQGGFDLYGNDNYEFSDKFARFLYADYLGALMALCLCIMVLVYTIAIDKNFKTRQPLNYRASGNVKSFLCSNTCSVAVRSKGYSTVVLAATAIMIGVNEAIKYTATLIQMINIRYSGDSKVYSIIIIVCDVVIIALALVVMLSIDSISSLLLMIAALIAVVVRYIYISKLDGWKHMFDTEHNPDASWEFLLTVCIPLYIAIVGIICFVRTMAINKAKSESLMKNRRFY